MPADAAAIGAQYALALEWFARYGPMWPLKGRLECGTCGRPLSPHSTRHGHKVYRYYRCRATAGGQPPCGYPVPAGLLENAVADHFPNRTRDEIISQRIRQLVDHVVHGPASGSVEIEWRPRDDEKGRLLRVQDRYQLVSALPEFLG